MSPNLDSPIQTQMAVAVVKSPLGNGECNGTIRIEGNSRKERCLCSNRDGLHFGDGVGPDGDELILMTVEVGTSRRGGVATQPGMLQLGASGDASTVHQDFNKNTSGKKQRYKKRSRTKSDGSESLSDIDDSEIVGYLNDKKEMHLKRMLWEAMNKEHVKVKKQKPATETKKTTTARKAVKTTEKLEQQSLQAGRSSRINYDALRILSDDMEQGCGTAHDVDLILDSWRNDYS